jgi:hypothetical protein
MLIKVDFFKGRLKTESGNQITIDFIPCERYGGSEHDGAAE